MKKALVVLGILLGSFFVPSTPAYAMSGTGSASDPFIISSVTDLQNMGNNLTAYYELASDIDASTTSTWNVGAGFVPVGTPSVPFTGYFDGKEYTVSGLSINRPSTDYQGLFGGLDGDVHNLRITGATIVGDSSVGMLAGRASDCDITDVLVTGTVAGSSVVGGFVGEYDGTSVIADCSAVGALTVSIGNAGGFFGYQGGDSLIERCYADVEISGGAWADTLGGFGGYASDGTVSQCYALGDVDGHYQVCGFIAETAFGAGTPVYLIEDCYARGNVHGADSAAGFVCLNGVGAGKSATIENCYSTGMVWVDETVGPEIGGFCYDNGDTITNCFWDTETSGQATSDGGTGKTTAEMKTKTTYTDALWDFTNTWKMGGAQPGGWAAFWLASIVFLLFAGIMFGATKNPGLSIIMAFPLVAVAAWLGIGTTMLNVVLIVVLVAAVIFAIYFILHRFA